MKSAVTGSAVVHAGLTVAVLLWRSGTTVLVPGPDVVQVSLVEAPPTAAPAAPTPPAPAAKPAPAPTEDTGVRIEKQKQKPKPAEKPSEEAPAPPAAKPVPPTTAPVVALPYADMGGGMRGQVAVDANNFEFAYYLQQVRVLIARNWTPQPGLPPGTHADVYFRVSRDGSITAPVIERSSGNEFFDQSAQRAVIVTGHLPPLPFGWSGSDLGIHFGFEYTGS
jgi:TonB family protein